MQLQKTFISIWGVVLQSASTTKDTKLYGRYEHGWCECDADWRARVAEKALRLDYTVRGRMHDCRRWIKGSQRKRLNGQGSLCCEVQGPLSGGEEERVGRSNLKSIYRAVLQIDTWIWHRNSSRMPKADTSSWLHFIRPILHNNWTPGRCFGTCWHARP